MVDNNQTNDATLSVDPLKAFTDDDFKTKVVKVHQNNKETTFFDKDQLEKDPEAREMEKYFSHAKEPQLGYRSNWVDDQFYTTDEQGNRVPSIYSHTNLNEYGVNENGKTKTQLLEEEQEARSAFEEYSVRYADIQTRMQRLKTEQKELDIEFKDLGLDVSAFKRAIKWQMQNRDKTEEQKWYEGVTRSWAQSSQRLHKALDVLVQAKDETKEAGSDKEARRNKYLQNTKNRYEKRYDRDEQTGRVFIDNQIERNSVLATYGIPRAEEELIKLDESKKVQMARKRVGAEPLAIHDNNIRPANIRQKQKVFGDEYIKRLEEKKRQEAEDNVFNPLTPDEKWGLDYTPTDVPVEFDYQELAKHGIYQVQRQQDCAHLARKLLDGEQIPDKAKGKWLEKFKNFTKDELYKLIKVSAKAEDYLELKQACDDILLKPDDKRRDEFEQTPMRVARFNRLVRTGKLPGNVINYDPQNHQLCEIELEQEQAKDI